MAGEQSRLAGEKEGELQAKLEGCLLSREEEVVVEVMGLVIRQLAGEGGGGVVDTGGGSGLGLGSSQSIIMLVLPLQTS